MENLRLSRWPSNWSGHEVVYLPVEVVVRLEPDGIEDRVIFQVFVDIRRGEGRVPPHVELLIHRLILVHYRGEELFPAVCRVDVARSQDRPLAVTEIVEEEERVIAGGFKMTVVGGALLVSVDRRLGTVYVQYHLLRLRERYGLGDPAAVEGGEGVDVLILCEYLSLETRHRSRACRCSL